MKRNITPDYYFVCKNMRETQNLCIPNLNNYPEIYVNIFKQLFLERTAVCWLEGTNNWCLFNRSLKRQNPTAWTSNGLFFNYFSFNLVLQWYFGITLAECFFITKNVYIIIKNTSMLLFQIKFKNLTFFKL